VLTYLKGDMFNSPAQVLVNTVNVVGVMGKGVALEFKSRYPDMFKQYQKICEDKSLDIGKLFLWKKSDKWVLLFPTKKHWKNPSKLEFIQAGLEKFKTNWYKMGIESIAFPRLGCGNGGLDWNDVRPMMEQYLKPLPIKIYIYVDNYGNMTPEHKQVTEMEKWLKENPKLIGFEMLKEELLKALKKSNHIPLPDGTTGYVDWEKENISIRNGHSSIIKENELCDFWDYVRDVGILETEKIPEQFQPYGYVMLEVLKLLDYLQPVIISNNGVDFNVNSNGYQYIKD
jgi:O-acetyl-ADP-ribose deacetylase (regulator of RNase III)